MKAAVIDKPGSLVVQEIPMPVPGEFDVLCELLYGATCSGTDLHLIDGIFPWLPSYPAILGHESIGKVVEIGKQVRNFKVGDLVTRVGAPKMPQVGLDICWGGFAEYGLARDHWEMYRQGIAPDEWNSYRVNQIVPPEIDPRDATMLITWRETFSYITRMGVTKGASILVLGSGGNGLSFINHAVNIGANPIVMVGNVTRKETAFMVGATHVFDYTSLDWQNQAGELCPEGFDFIIDAVGKQTSAKEGLKQVKSKGVFGIYGIDDFGQLQLDPFQARGRFQWNPIDYDEAEAHTSIVNFVLALRLKASLWMDLQHPLPFIDIGEAYASLRRKEKIKILIQIK
jgi:D-arabinose 1-dehydrogenase-like Zn-dependent alcohol dehydrogenase